ncbi:MAG: CopG family transcriptional regulator [Burkholderiaceae bacterium]|jgi:hypothetical protein|nr:CopG family transcriptional regulator [Burkholderiaceae bacterium]
MRTTLAIDDDVLAAAKGLAAREGKSLGEVVSALARQALHRPAAPAAVRNGVPLLAVQAGAMPATPELVNRLRDELP